MSNFSTQLKSIPNMLSLLRIVLIPFFIAAYLSGRSNGRFMLSSAILVLSGLTDMLDGIIARKFNMVTDVGKILDPVADKLTQFAIIICLCLQYPTMPLLFGVFVVKELLMLTGGVLLMRKKIHPGGAKWFGKLATAFFYVSMIGIVLLPELKDNTVNLIILINTLLLLFSLVMYIPLFFKLKKGV